jgi:hypothetical protein
MKEGNKLVFKNLYLGMPLKDAVVILEQLLGEKLDIRADSSEGFELGRYSNRSALDAQIELAASLSSPDLRVNGTIVKADKAGNCLEFDLGRKDLDKLFQTPELAGADFLAEFVKAYEINFSVADYLPKLDAVTYANKIDLGFRKRYEAIDPRGVELIFYVYQFDTHDQQVQAAMMGLEKEMLILQSVASESDRKSKFN